MKIKASGWPATGHHKNILNGLAKLEFRAEDHEQALLLLSISKLFEPRGQMDALDKLILGMGMHEHGLVPIKLTKQTSKQFDELYKSLRSQFEPPKPTPKAKKAK